VCHDLSGLSIHDALAVNEHDTVGVLERSEQVHGPPVAVAGRRPISNRARTTGVRSRAHSPIAVNDRAPASTAHTPIPSSTATWWRTPRRARGSATAHSAVSRSADDGTAHAPVIKTA
jgi:hypothetical protein